MNKITFKKSKDIDEYQYFHVYTSKEYGIALYRVMFGFRVRIWKLTNTTSVEADLCFGSHPKYIDKGYRTLLAYLENGGSTRDIPFQKVKPFPEHCEFTSWLENKITQFPNPKKGKVTPTILQEGLLKSITNIYNEYNN